MPAFYSIIDDINRSAFPLMDISHMKKVSDNIKSRDKIRTLRNAASFSISRTKNTGCYRSKDKEDSKMPYNRKVFGVVISRLRVQKGLTQERMSGLAGIARSHLVALENGEKTAKLDTMWRIADALGVRPCELIRQMETEICRNEISD